MLEYPALSENAATDVSWPGKTHFRGGITPTVNLRAATLAVLVLMGCTATGLAQDASATGEPASAPTTTFFLARTAQRLDASFAGTFHYLEFFQVRNRWIYPDIGYVDFAHSNYREFFVGGGRTLIENKWAAWDLELLYDQATGPAAGSAAYLQPFTILRLFFTPKISGEAEYFAYLPLNDSAKFHNVLERTKIEYAVKKRWKIGAGYAGVNRLGTAWQNKPFITTTISTEAGAFELWLQRIPNGAQAELRYRLVHKSLRRNASDPAPSQGKAD